ncbi:MAG: Gfo/Idh/MocA family oxidoreductase [Acidobacteriaceae bacterium]|nr:Gfo/Idh/MocA family oxidoreductase [Acidobacteriaceae bacterium]
MSTHSPLRYAVVGAGAFGRNHLRVVRELEQDGEDVRLVAVVDCDQAAREAAREFGIPAFCSVEECLEATRVDAASICTPTSAHAEAALPLVDAGVDLLIEKPLASSLEDADRILALAREKGRIIQTGHLERFNPAVAAAQKLLNKPMFFEAHRLSLFTPRSLDVDVVLDLMIHDLDIVLSLVTSPIREVRAVGLPVLSHNVDIANVRVEFANGCVANFTASRVSTERVRKLRFFQPHQYLSLDFARQDLFMIDVSSAAKLDPAKIAAMAQKLQGTQLPNGTPAPGMSLHRVSVEPGEPLRLEIASFLNAVRSQSCPVVSGDDGRRALALALHIRSEMTEHARRAGL